MFSFFSMIQEWIIMIVNFVISTFKLIMNFLKIIPQAIGWLVSIVTFIPPFVAVFVTVPIAVSVLLNVMNKGG